MKFEIYKCEFIGNINDTHILIDKKSYREIPGLFKISRDTTQTKNDPGSRELNPILYSAVVNNTGWIMTLYNFNII